jgi:HEPN domain-containing protein
MKNETKIWLRYAEENLRSARILLDSGLYNPCLQNSQQAVEKALKAVLIEKESPLRKTYSISELAKMLEEINVDADLDENACDLLDAVYLPSKYPLGSALPHFEPNKELCQKCIAIAERVLKSLENVF